MSTLKYCRFSLVAVFMIVGIILIVFGALVRSQELVTISEIGDCIEGGGCFPKTAIETLHPLLNNSVLTLRVLDKGTNEEGEMEMRIKDPKLYCPLHFRGTVFDAELDFHQDGYCGFPGHKDCGSEWEQFCDALDLVGCRKTTDVRHTCLIKEINGHYCLATGWDVIIPSDGHYLNILELAIQDCHLIGRLDISIEEFDYHETFHFSEESHKIDDVQVTFEQLPHEVDWDNQYVIARKIYPMGVSGTNETYRWSRTELCMYLPREDCKGVVKAPNREMAHFEPLYDSQHAFTEQTVILGSRSYSGHPNHGVLTPLFQPALSLSLHFSEFDILGDGGLTQTEILIHETTLQKVKILTHIPYSVLGSERLDKPVFDIDIDGCVVSGEDGKGVCDVSGTCTGEGQGLIFIRNRDLEEQNYEDSARVLCEKVIQVRIPITDTNVDKIELCLDTIEDPWDCQITDLDHVDFIPEAGDNSTGTGKDPFFPDAINKTGFKIAFYVGGGVFLLMSLGMMVLSFYMGDCMLEPSVFNRSSRKRSYETVDDERKGKFSGDF